MKEHSEELEVLDITKASNSSEEDPRIRGYFRCVLGEKRFQFFGDIELGKAFTADEISELSTDCFFRDLARGSESEWSEQLTSSW